MAENSLPFCFAQEILLIQFNKSCFCLFFLQSPLILILTFDLNLICLTVVVVFLSL